MTTVTQDRVAFGLAALEGLGALVLVVVAFADLTRGQVLYGIAFLVVGLVLGVMAAIWWLRSRVDVTVTPEGIRRAGRYGWELPWAGIGQVEVREIRSLLGTQLSLLIEPLGTLPPYVQAEARTTRSLRRRVPAGMFAVPVNPADAQALTAALAARG